MMGIFIKDFQDVILPVITVFVVYNIVGLFGNITVLYVYGFRYPGTHFRCLVLVLSLVDLTSCCTTVPMETVSTWFWFSAPSRGMCKAKNFFVQLTALSAMYMLFITAIYKYRQICKPFGKQMIRKTVAILCISGICVSLLCATPAAILWDINNHTVTINNTTERAMICEVQAGFHGTWYPASYRHLLSAYAILLFVTIVLYVFVAKSTILHCKRLKRRMLKPQVQPALPKINPVTIQPKLDRTVVPTIDGIDKIPVNHLAATHTAVVDLPDFEATHVQLSEAKSRIKTKSNSTESLGETNLNISELSTVSKAKPKHAVTQINVRKVLIMVIIAGTFSVTFLMGLSFGYVFASRDYKDYKSISELILLFCFYRFYLINYALNPVVYFFLDTRFRREVIQLLIRTSKTDLSLNKYSKKPSN